MIAVFKISLTLCISICRAFGQIGKWGWGGSQRKEGDGWLVVIYKHSVLWLPFPRLKLQNRLVTHYFFMPAFSLRFSYMCVHTLKASQHSPLFSHTLNHTHKKHTRARTHTYTPSACIHTPRLSLATELPLQWDHHFRNKAARFKSPVLTILNIL